MSSHLFSVIVATLNRAPYLEKALLGLSEQSLSRKSFEVIVVDNGSTDRTSQVLDAYKSRLQIVSLKETSLGSSAARNRGLEVARGRYIAFLDDDAIPDAGWLAAMLSAFEETRPAPACVGGAILPIWEGGRPEWMRGLLLDFVTVVDHSHHRKLLTDIIHRQKLASANMGVVANDLRRVGGFPLKLGRVGDCLLSGEDVLVELKLEQLGLPILYDPAVRVRHHVSSQRTTPEWLSGRAYWGGVSDALLAFLIRPQTALWAMRTLLWGLRDAVKSPKLMAASMARPSPENILQHCCGRHKQGFIDGGCRAVAMSLADRAEAGHSV